MNWLSKSTAACSENKIAYQLHAQYNLQIYCELCVCWKMIIALMEGRDFWIRYSCTYMYSNEQSVKQKQKIMVIIYEEQRHFLDILIILSGFLGVVNVYQFNIVVIMQWTFYYETWAFKKKWIMYNKLSVQLYHMYRRWLVSMDS